MPAKNSCPIRATASGPCATAFGSTSAFPACDARCSSATAPFPERCVHRRRRARSFTHQESPVNAPKKFASQADLEEKQVSFTKLSHHAYAYTAEGDPNTGIIVGDDAVLVADT